MAMSMLETKKLESLESRLGSMSSIEALAAAIEAETTSKMVGPFDGSFEHFARKARDLEGFAVLLEKDGR